MPTVKFVNALDSFAGGLAGGLQAAQETKRQTALDAERQQQQAVENTLNEQRMAMAQRDQAMQDEIFARKKANDDAARNAQAAMQIASQTGKTRADVLKGFAGTVDPDTYTSLESLAFRHDARDEFSADIEHDIAAGVLDDVQAGPDGKEQRVPNPERMGLAQNLLQMLKAGHDPEEIMRAYVPMKAEIIGQKSQQIATQRLFESKDAEIKDAQSRGYDTSELDLAFTELTHARDPYKLLNDPKFQHRWDLGRRGLVGIPGPDGEEFQVPPSQAPAVRKLIYDAFQAKQEREARKAEQEVELNKQRIKTLADQGKAALIRAANPGSNRGKPYDEDAELRKKAGDTGYKTPDEINAFVYLNSSENKNAAQGMPDEVKSLPIVLQMDVLSQLKKIGDPEKMRAAYPDILKRAQGRVKEFENK